MVSMTSRDSRTRLSKIAPDQHTLLSRLSAHNGIAFDLRRHPSTRFFSTGDGVSLHALDWPDAGEPILFLHGGALTAHTWDLVCLDLSDSFHCVSLDLRGHGESGW